MLEWQLIAVLTSIFWGDKVHVLHIFAAGLDVVVNCVGRYRADLHQAVMLDENGVAGQVSVDDRRNTAVEITENRISTNEIREL